LVVRAARALVVRMVAARVVAAMAMRRAVGTTAVVDRTERALAAH